MELEIIDKIIETKEKNNVYILLMVTSGNYQSASQAENVESLDHNFKNTLNVSQNPELAIKYNINHFPATLFFQNGEVFNILYGVSSKQDLEVNLS